MDNYYQKNLEDMTIQELKDVRDWCQVCKVVCSRSRDSKNFEKYRKKIGYITKLIKYKTV